MPLGFGLFRPRPFLERPGLAQPIAYRPAYEQPGPLGTLLIAMKMIFSQTSQPESSTLFPEEWNAARDITRDLYGISGLWTYRHRVDGRNIVVWALGPLQWLPVTIVVRDPQFLPYPGPMPSTNGLQKASSLTL